MIQVEISSKGICDLCQAVGMTPVDESVHRIVSDDIIVVTLCKMHAGELRSAIRSPTTEETPPPRKQRVNSEPILDRFARKLTSKCRTCIK